MKNHVRKLHLDEKVKCEKCEKSYSSKTALKLHERTKHLSTSNEGQSKLKTSKKIDSSTQTENIDPLTDFVDSNNHETDLYNPDIVPNASFVM